MNLKKILLDWGPTVAVMGVIFYLSSQQRISVSESITVNFAFFKSLHVIEYAMLYVLVFRAMHNTFYKIGLKKVFWYSVLITFLYAVSDELHQTFVPTRNGQITDVLIDSIGIFTAKYYTEKYYSKIKSFL